MPNGMPPVVDAPIVELSDLNAGYGEIHVLWDVSMVVRTADAEKNHWRKLSDILPAAPQLRLGVGYEFPFKVTVNIGDSIGGPSAGLMFALSIYDVLTPGSLTAGGTVAGTGTITGNGRVGEIGGIQQKIVGARNDGAQLFLVPADNCEDTQGAHNGDMRLVRVDTFDTAKSAIETWAEDHDAKLPSCS